MTPSLRRRAAAEAIGTAGLVAVVVGSGIQAAQLTADVGLRLLANSFATALGLGVLIAVFGPVSGAHFNPVVSLADWWLGRRTRSGLSLRAVAYYVPAQIVGAIGGAVLANLMFGLPAVTVAHHDRSAPHLLLAEVVATAGLVLVIFALARTGRTAAIPAAVGAYLGAAYWFTASTSFANPAVTIGRSLSDTFAGIAPASVPGFVVAQAIGAAVGVAAVIGAGFGREWS
jgi:glycerol uptake facilitator-like aquaporin